MFFFKFSSESGEVFKFEFWEEKRCLICYTYKAKMSKEMENEILQTIQSITISPEQYSTLDILYRNKNEERAKNYINRFIFSHIPLLAEIKKEEEENEL